jgi:hypothetical protein
MLQERKGRQDCGPSSRAGGRHEMPQVRKTFAVERPRIILLTAHDDKVGKALAPVVCASVVLDKQDGMNKLIECAQSLLER